MLVRLPFLSTTKNPLHDWQIGKCRHPKIQFVSHGRHRGSALRWKKNELDNAPFQDVWLIENGDFPIAMLVCQVLNIVSLGTRSLEQQIVILWFYQFQLLAANSAMAINPISARVISSSFECYLVTSQDHYPLYHPWDKCQYALEDTPNFRRFLQLKQKTSGERCFWVSFQEKAREMVLVRLKDDEVSFWGWKRMIWLVI